MRDFTSTRTDGYQSRRGVFRAAIFHDAQQFRVGHLFHALDPVIQFGRLIRLDVDFDYFPYFRRFTRGEVARRYRLRDDSFAEYAPEPNPETKKRMWTPGIGARL